MSTQSTSSAPRRPQTIRARRAQYGLQDMEREKAFRRAWKALTKAQRSALVDEAEGRIQSDPAMVWLKGAGRQGAVRSMQKTMLLEEEWGIAA